MNLRKLTDNYGRRVLEKAQKRIDEGGEQNRILEKTQSQKIQRNNEIHKNGRRESILKLFSQRPSNTSKVSFTII